MTYLEGEVLKPGELAALVAQVADRELDPYSAAGQLLERARRA